MLITSIFSFSHNVFKNHLLQDVRIVSYTEKLNEILENTSDHMAAPLQTNTLFHVLRLKAVFLFQYCTISSSHINPFPNKPCFLRVCRISLLKTLWEKEKLLVTSNFSFFPQCYLPIRRTYCHCHHM